MVLSTYHYPYVHGMGHSVAAEEAVAKKRLPRIGGKRKTRKQPGADFADCASSDEESDCNSSVMSSPEPLLSKHPVTPRAPLCRSTSILFSPRSQADKLRRQQLEREMEDLITGIEIETSRLSKKNKELHEILLVHTDRAKARYAASNEKGTLISLRRVKRIEAELAMTMKAIEYLDGQMAVVQDAKFSPSGSSMQQLIATGMDHHREQVESILSSPPRTTAKQEGHLDDFEAETTDSDLLEQFSSGLTNVQ